MKTIINYIRSIFCKHDFELIGYTHLLYVGKPAGARKTYRCKKCGYVQKVKI